MAQVHLNGVVKSRLPCGSITTGCTLCVFNPVSLVVVLSVEILPITPVFTVYVFLSFLITNVRSIFKSVYLLFQPACVCTCTKVDQAAVYDLMF